LPAIGRELMQDAHTKAAENQDAARSAHRAVTVPQFINEDKSDMRGIKSGWYARDNTGNLVSGPFVSREQCVERINQETKSPTRSSVP
jgi:hypothetical protein